MSYFIRFAWSMLLIPSFSLTVLHACPSLHVIIATFVAASLCDVLMYNVGFLILIFRRLTLVYKHQRNHQNLYRVEDIEHLENGHHSRPRDDPECSHL